MGQNLEELFIAFQRLIPQHLLSRTIAQLAESKTPAVKNFLIRQFIRRYAIDLDELENREPEHYASFNDFFTRPLRAGARSIAVGNDSVVSPADGSVSQIGTIDNERLIQAKGKYFTVEDLIGSRFFREADFKDGLFTTLYLSPRDYHRVHMPTSGRLIATQYIPGQLFSVNQATSQLIDNLFAKNERLVCLFEGEAGTFAIILVGAMLVAGIESVWHGHYKSEQPFFSESNAAETFLEKGEEMGRFKYGSTVILLFQQGALQWLDNWQEGMAIRMGELLGSLNQG